MHADVSTGGIEVLQHSHDVLAVAFRPDGKQLATATLDGQIHFWDPQEGELQVCPVIMSPHTYAYHHFISPHHALQVTRLTTSPADTGNN